MVRAGSAPAWCMAHQLLRDAATSSCAPQHTAASHVKYHWLLMAADDNDCRYAGPEGHGNIDHN